MKTRLKELRKKAGWKNADDFAASIGIPPKTYRNYEQGTRGMNLDVASELCNALGCSLTDLVGEVGENESLSADEQDLLSAFRRMEPEEQQTILATARAFALAGDAKKRSLVRDVTMAGKFMS